MTSAQEENLKNSRHSDHMANERTFLSWIRTSLGIMAFGFVVEKFAFFLKQLSFLVGAGHPETSIPPPPQSPGYSSVFGIIVVGLGVLITLLSFIKYVRIEKQIREGKYQTSHLLEIILTVSVLLMGIYLIVILLRVLTD